MGEKTRFSRVFCGLLVFWWLLPTYESKERRYLVRDLPKHWVFPHVFMISANLANQWNPKYVHTMSEISQNTVFCHVFLVCSHSNCGVILSRWFMCFYIYVFTCNHLKSFKVQTLPNLLPYCLPIYLCMYIFIFIFIFIYLQSPAVILSSDPPQPIARLSCLSMYIFFYFYFYLYLPAITCSQPKFRPSPTYWPTVCLFIYVYNYIYIRIYFYIYTFTCNHLQSF